MEDLRSYLDQKFAHIDQKFERIDLRFAQMDARFERIDTRFERIDQRFEQIDQRFEQIDQRFEQIDQRFAQMDARFEHIEERLDRMDQRFERIEVRLAAVEDAVRKQALALETARHDFKLAFEGHQAISKVMIAKDEGLEKEMKELRGLVTYWAGGLTTRVNKVEQDLKDLAGVVDRLVDNPREV